jgi:sugar transferase (PEP-CTERM/EpsH1 system associated)
MREMLFLAHRIPYPPAKGDKIRAWHFLQHFTKSRRVHLGCFIDDPQDWQHVEFVKQFVGQTCFLPLPRARALARSLPAIAGRRPLTFAYYDDLRMRRWVRQLRASRPLTTFVYSSAMAQFVASERGAPRIIDFVDVDSQKWSAYASRKRWPLSTVYRREGQALLAAERKIAADFDASLFVSDVEAADFRRLAPESSQRVSSVSIGVDWQYFSPDLAFPDPYAGRNGRALCFTGMMEYWPNVDAVTWFATTVMPRLRRSDPTATFWIVGANPVRDVRRLEREPGVIVTGRVPDTRPYLAHASAVVAPLRIARGIQSKVLEAMAMGRPVVASLHAFEGLRVQPDRDLLLAQDADEFVRAIERIWTECALRGLGERARQSVQILYDWNNQLANLDAVMASVEGTAGAITSPAMQCMTDLHSVTPRRTGPAL